MESNNDDFVHTVANSLAAHFYTALSQRLRSGDASGLAMVFDSRNNNLGPLGASLPMAISSAVQESQAFLNGQPAMMQLGGAIYAPTPDASGIVLDDSSDDDPLSSAPSPTADSTASTGSSPEPSSREDVASSATSPTSPATPTANLLKALHDAKLTRKADPTMIPESSGASRLKRSYSEMSGRTASGKRLMGESDPENREIMRLRQEKNLEFDEIARIMNKKRVDQHMPASFTSNAIYSRYKRNGPLIAAADGKEFVPAPRDKKANGKGINFKKAFVLERFDAEDDELLVRAHKEIEDQKWSLVAERLHELGGAMHAPEMCSSRYACL